MPKWSRARGRATPSSPTHARAHQPHDEGSIVALLSEQPAHRYGRTSTPPSVRQVARSVALGDRARPLGPLAPPRRPLVVDQHSSSASARSFQPRHGAGARSGPSYGCVGLRPCRSMPTAFVLGPVRSKVRSSAARGRRSLRGRDRTAIALRGRIEVRKLPPSREGSRCRGARWQRRSRRAGVAHRIA